jgi:hypothetical protein
MARRPVFHPVLNGPPFVEETLLEFTWHPGFAKSQARKSIASLHEAAKNAGLAPVLEISSKSDSSLGVALSAFNLIVAIQGRRMSVESAYQGSKVFEHGGPFHGLYEASGKDAKTDDRLRSSGAVIHFNLLGEKWPTEPFTAFYDWLYIKALFQHPELAQAIIEFEAFSDIAYNPERSFNCQARAAAVFVALSRQHLLQWAIKGRDSYLELMSRTTKDGTRLSPQQDLFSNLE